MIFKKFHKINCANIAKKLISETFTYRKLHILEVYAQVSGSTGTASLLSSSPSPTVSRLASSLIRGLEQPNRDQLRQFSLQQIDIPGQGSNETATFVQVI
jgi:hypothetical protein